MRDDEQTPSPRSQTLAVYLCLSSVTRRKLATEREWALGLRTCAFLTRAYDALFSSLFGVCSHLTIFYLLIPK